MMFLWNSYGHLSILGHSGQVNFFGRGYTSYNLVISTGKTAHVCKWYC